VTPAVHHAEYLDVVLDPPEVDDIAETAKGRIYASPGRPAGTESGPQRVGDFQGLAVARVVGIGYRSEPAVDAALLRSIAPLIDGEVASRALAMLRERLEAQARTDGHHAARERVQRDLAATQRKAKNLADAIACGGEMEPLLVALREQNARADALATESAQLENARPVAADARRTLAAVKKRLGELSNLLHRGGVEARPVVAAVLGSERLVATPVVVDGSRHWQLTGHISCGYLVCNVVKESSGLCPSCAAPRELRRALRQPRPSDPPSAASVLSSA
jgi:hypothetical protein